MAAEFVPALTTMRQNYSLLAAHAVQTIIDYISGKNVGQEIIITTCLSLIDKHFQTCQSTNLR